MRMQRKYAYRKPVLTEGKLTPTVERSLWQLKNWGYVLVTVMKHEITKEDVAMGRYVPRSEKEVRGLLERMGFEEVWIAGTRELIFERDTEEKDVRIRVYTSVDPKASTRGVGRDAGRVVLVHKEFRRPIWQSARVYRTKGFLENLRKRCREAYKAVASSVKCPECDNIMVLRKRGGQKKPSFWGCSQFPKCRATRNWKR